MEIMILHIAECPSLAVAEDHTRAALGRISHASSADVSSQLITTPEEAKSWGFAGSPTILINGFDAFPSDAGTENLACRVYATPDGLRPAPTVDQLHAVITAALAS